jgi:nucleotide-binding universal stress UspA family protein
MTYVVGYSPHKDDACALSLAAQFARSDKDSVHAVTVVPQGWEVAAGSATDGDFTAWAQGQGEASAEEALALLGADAGVPIAASWVTGRSVPAALLEQVEALDADMIVVGSGANGAPGRVAMTAKTDRLLHSSPVPVAIAPRGYAAEPGSRSPGSPSGSATTTPRGTCSSGWRTSVVAPVPRCGW